MKVKFPENLNQFMASDGRLFRASHHEDKTIDLSIYGINSADEFEAAGFAVIDRPNQKPEIEEEEI